ncbi:MAG: hypothetical protein IKS52_10040 [Clostridia bacterium]|nr:hypothetical protein [Clostridia bacterium]MBR4443593.1 hypothetical protein [Clostridia bacterium]
MSKMIAIMIEMAVSVLVLWVLSFLSTLLHELGHAFGYMLSTGDRHWHIRVGTGKKLLETKPLTVKMLIFDGCFYPAENRIDTNAKLISMLSGGPVISLVLVIVLLLLRYGSVSFNSGIIASSSIEFFINYALFLNVFILVLAIIPSHYFHGEIKGMETDGLKILNAIKGRKAP